jgi:iron complex transport system substrate-binding protein
MRVVSLLPSATEMLYALGVEPVAVSQECDHPPAATKLPAADRTRIESGGSSEEINEQVAEAEGDVYELREDVLLEVDPDLVVTQGVCEVCAIGDRQVQETVEDLELDAEVVTTHPHSLDDVLADVGAIGEKTGRSERARELVADLRGQIEYVRERAPATGKRVVVLDWMDPIMVAGHWIPGMVETAGGTYGMANPGERSRPRAFEELLDYDPEVLILAPCGFPIDATIEHVGEVTAREGYGDLTAVREGDVYAMDGQGHVNRPGPRLVDTLEAIAGLLAPDVFDSPPDDVARRVETREARAD